MYCLALFADACGSPSNRHDTTAAPTRNSRLAVLVVAPTRKLHPQACQGSWGFVFAPQPRWFWMIVACDARLVHTRVVAGPCIASSFPDDCCGELSMGTATRDLLRPPSPGAFFSSEGKFPFDESAILALSEYLKNMPQDNISGLGCR